MNSKNFSTPIDLHKVRITDDFWGREQELVRREVIPYQWEALNDRVPGAAPSFCMRNFKVAGRLMKEKKTRRDFAAPTYTFRGFNALPEEGKEPEEDKFYGFVFQDSDFAKWIEAVGYSLINHPDGELERIADEAIDIVCAAQAENGYLDTYYIINGMDRIFTNLRDHHELYCFGHLVEGAVSYYRATGKDKLLKAAERYGDFIASYFGPGEGQCKGYPGHEIAEMALAELYELTGEEKYLNLGKFFLDMRGTRPYYFDEEAKERAAYEGTPYRENTDTYRYTYHQANEPVREQSEAAGHAVRAVYLYSGMADAARLTGDDSLYRACERLWNNIVEEKLYITGGIGGTHLGEAFSFPYDLPNDTAYSETCAAIGLAFFARRMLEIQADNRYSDVMELALYNTVLAGMALDGKSFFYVNPLEVLPAACKRDGRKEHVKAVRQKWFGCACCPPNIARIVSSLGAYVYTRNEDTLFTHLYVGSTVSQTVGEDTLDMKLESAFPWEGEVKAVIHAEKPVRSTLAFRIPGWCRDAHVEVYRDRKKTSMEEENLAAIHIRDGEILSSAAKEDLTGSGNVSGEGNRHDSSNGLPLENETIMECNTTMEVEIFMEKGYLYLTGDWQNEDVILLHFPMEVHCVKSNTRVRENIGKVAFTRGPVCYCMEEADNGENLHLCRVNMEAIRKRTQECGKDTQKYKEDTQEYGKDTQECAKETQEFGKEKQERGKDWKVPKSGIRIERSTELGHEMRVLKVPGIRQQASPAGASLYSDCLEAASEPDEKETVLTLIPYYAWSNRGEGEMCVWIRA